MNILNLNIFLLQSASRVYVKDVDLIYVRVGVYHGTEPLCPEKQSKQVSPGDPKWQDWLDLDIQKVANME